MQIDRYSQAVITLIRRRYDEWETSPPTAADIRRPTEQRRLAKIGSVHGIELPVEDEDWPARTWAEKALHTLFRSPVYPLWDDATPWPSPAVAVAELSEWLGPRLLPAEGVRWPELASDEAQSRFAFAGLAAPWLRREGDGFVVDFGWLGDLPVRDGFERYGAVAWFDADRRLVRIHTTHDAVPGDPGWDHAKFVWRSSVLVGVTLAHHLWGLHLYAANRVVTATREELPPEHPVRLLLKPFTFRTAAINHRAAAILVVPRGLMHRAFALTWDGLVAALRHGDADGRLRSVRARLAERGTLDLPAFPYASDAVALEDVVRRYVDRCTPDVDPALVRWWSALGDLVTGPPSREGLVDAITAFVFASVGQHRHLGALRDYLLDPSFLSSRIRAGSEQNDQQGSRLLMLVVAGTGLRQPALLSDFHHLLPRDRPEAAAALDGFLGELRALSARIVDQNRTRRWPYTGMDPARLECSVAM